MSFVVAHYTLTIWCVCEGLITPVRPCLKPLLWWWRVDGRSRVIGRWWCGRCYWWLRDSYCLILGQLLPDIMCINITHLHYGNVVVVHTVW